MGKRIYNLEFFKKLAISKSGECLSTEYIACDKKLKFKCSFGDIVLYAMLNKGILSEGVLGIELITLNENEFALYCVDERANDGKGIPAVNLK